jgi:hypothetical protein
MHHHPRRLVHHRQVLVLIQNVQRNVFGRRVQRLGLRLALNLDRLAAAQLLLGLRGRAVHPHLPGFDQQLHPRAADVTRASG